MIVVGWGVYCMCWLYVYVLLMSRFVYGTLFGCVYRRDGCWLMLLGEWVRLGPGDVKYTYSRWIKGGADVLRGMYLPKS